MSSLSTYARYTAIMVALVPVAASAAEEVRPEPSLWLTLTGILGIPALLIGLVYSYALIKKMRIETRRGELEVEEKERAVAASISDLTEARRVVAPIAENRRVHLLILRFVMLYVVLLLWDVVAALWGAVVGNAYLFETRHYWPGRSDLFLAVLLALAALPTVGRWLIAIGLGWPLLRDLNRFFGVDLSNLRGLLKGLWRAGQE